MGVFIGVKVSDEDLQNIEKLQKDINLPNCVNKENIHASLFITKDEISYTPEKYDKPIKVSDLSLKKMRTQKGVDCLVISFDNEDLQLKYQYIQAFHNVKSFYKELKLHITISYNCGDIDIEKINLSNYIKDLTIVSEYAEEVNFQKPYKN